MQTRPGDDASAFRSWIDSPVDRWAPLNRFRVRGWCYHRKGLPITAIRLRLGSETFAGRYGEERPDVVAAFSGEAGNAACGFDIPVTTSSRAPDYMLQAQLTDGAWHDVQIVALNRNRFGGWRNQGKWSRFWLGAWLGRSDGWSRLSATDRDVALERVTSRGWFNLATAPQYAPRAVVPERFPAPRASALELPRLGIVTPSFQQGAFVGATIASVLEQEGVRIAYVVQDGGSSDGSVEAIRVHERHLAHWESAPDGGQADAVVRGFSKISLAPDDLMMYLNSDDLLISGAAHFVADFFARHPAVDAVYGHRFLIDRDGHDVGRWFTPRTAWADLSIHDFVPQETLFWRRRLWDRVGGIDPSLRFALDWDLLLRFRAAGARVVRLPWFIGCFRLHPAQKTTARLQEDGIPECNALRRRTLGRVAAEDELHLAMRRGQVDSALVCALFQRGWRV